MNRQEITVLNFYTVFPFNHGGSRELRGFCKGLSEWFDINLIVFDDKDIYKEEVVLSKHLKVFQIPFTWQLVEELYWFYEEYGFNAKSLIDYSVFASRFLSEMPKFVEKVRRISENSQIIITTHPYTYRLAKEACPEKSIWYRAQNVEYNYKKSTWTKLYNPELLLLEVFALEKECCDGSELILTITQDDADCFREMYNISPEKILNISAGYDFDSLEFTPPSKRKRKEDIYNLTALFISSDADVAVNAANNIVKIALDTPLVKYIIAGTVGYKINKKEIPNNVYIMGMVSEAEKIELLKMSDVALNLIEGGSGLNMKMLEYFAYGLPVISTKFGARGLDVTNRIECLITSESGYKNDILAFINMPISERDRLAQNALELLKRDYDWRNIAMKIISYIGTKYPNIYAKTKPVPQKETMLCEIPEIKQVVYDKNIPLFVWGAGNYGTSCLNMLKESGVTVSGIIDNDCDKWNKSIDGYKIFSPSDYFTSYRNSCVIVAVSKFIPILTQLIAGGILLENILLSYDGRVVVSLNSDNLPYYYDYYKLINLISKKENADE